MLVKNCLLIIFLNTLLLLLACKKCHNFKNAKLDQFERMHFPALEPKDNNYKKQESFVLSEIQAALVIRGLFFCEFAYSHQQQKESKIAIFHSKMDFLPANSRFAVQNDGSYLPRITWETCT